MKNKFGIISTFIVYIVFVLNIKSIISILPLTFFLQLPLIEICRDEGYNYKFYYTVSFTLLSLEGLLIIYIYQVYPLILNNPLNLGLFLLSLILLILLSIVNIYYLVTGKYKNFPWLTIINK